MAANLPSVGGSLSRSSSSFCSSFSSSSGSSPSRLGGSSKQTGSRKHGTSSAVCVVVLARMRFEPRPSFRISRASWKWSSQSDMNTRILACCLTTNGGSCISDVVYNWWLGCKSCRNGLELPGLQSVRPIFPSVPWTQADFTDAPTIFSIAGFDTMKSQWISGLNNVFYMVFTRPRAIYYTSL